MEDCRMNMEEVRKKVEEGGQEHLLKFWPELSEYEKEALLCQLASIDLKHATKAFHHAMIPKVLEESDVQPVNHKDFASESLDGYDACKAYKEIGLRAIRENKVCAILLAGGSGTRLGSAQPKGMFDIGLPSHKSLFELQANRIHKLQEIAKAIQGKDDKVVPSFCSITWAIMTSKETDQSTKLFLKEKQYFGLNEENVIFFQQGRMPCFDFNGKILMKSRFQICESANGNGGIYAALRESGLLMELKRRGIAFLHVYCVDNVLVKVADPIFIGYCVHKGVDAGVKVIPKTRANEPVGVFALLHDKYFVLEYSEMSKALSEREDSNGNLAFGTANIANHFFTLDFLSSLFDKTSASFCPAGMKFHVAKKKIAHIEKETGTLLVHPTQPNGIKLELFIFDVFPAAQKFALWQVMRDEEFAPLKNADKRDESSGRVSASLDGALSCKRKLYALHRKYLLENGAILNDMAANNGDVLHAGDTSSGRNERICEISPLLSYEGEDLRDLVEGKIFTYPIILKGSSES